MLQRHARRADAPAGHRDGGRMGAARLPRARALVGARPGRRLRRDPAVDPGRAAGRQGPGRRRLRGGAGGGARQRRQPGPGRPRSPCCAATGPRGWATASFDLVVSNPPYIASRRHRDPGAGGARPRAAPGAGRRRRRPGRLSPPGAGDPAGAEARRPLRRGDRLRPEGGGRGAVPRGRRGGRADAAATSPTATGLSQARKSPWKPAPDSLHQDVSPPKSSASGRGVPRRTHARPDRARRLPRPLA